MSKHILVVEDDPDTRRAVMLMLERCGYVVEGTEDGQAGLNALARSQFDGMVLDLYMPVLNGFDVLRSLKEKHLSLPVVMITGHPEHAEQAIAEGAKVCLIKPFERQELQQAADRWFGPAN